MGSRNFVIGLVASLLTVAAAIGLLFLVRGAGGSDVALPDRIGDLEAVTEPASVVDQLAVNTDEWAEAFDADADTRLYVDEATGDQVYVVAVADSSGPLLPEDGFVDGPSLGFELPLLERVVDGDVECLLHRSSPPRLGTDYQPDQAEPDSIVCQRSGSGLTVRVATNTIDQGAVVASVNDVWDELD